MSDLLIKKRVKEHFRLTCSTNLTIQPACNYFVDSYL
jgi:hypothetical protein